jgi:hypothetical protein
LISTVVIASSSSGTSSPAPSSGASPPPPPPMSTGGGTTGGGGSPSTAGSGSTRLASVTDLNTTDSPFGSGSGTESNDPGENIPPVKPAPQAQPKPASSDQSVGGSTHIYQTHFVPRRFPGVPGIDQDASTSGNRALWFSTVSP